MLTKREWTEEYKKLSVNFKFEERNMIQSHLSEDYHANKIFNSLLSEVEDEKKYVNNAIEKIKLSVNDIYGFLKGYVKGNNLEIRQKIIKIEEIINKNRMDFKNKFENLLLQEEDLENELMQLEMNFEFKNNINNNNIINNSNSNNNNSELDNEENKQNGLFLNKNTDNSSKINNNNQEKTNIESYIECIFSNTLNNNIFEEYSEPKVIKLVNKISDLGYIKDKTYQIELLIEKNLLGFNLGWQARDHQEFLKLRSAHNNRIQTYEFLSQLENILPFIPKSELKSHIKEYNRFTKLTDLKKLLINRYKEIKIDIDNNEKKKLLEKIEKKNQQNIFKDNIKINNFLKANPNIDANEISESKIINAVELEEIEKRKKLEEWKMEKELKRRELEDQRYREEIEKKEKEKYTYEEKKKILQPHLEEYKKYKNYLKQEQEYLKQQIINENKFEINEIDLDRIKEKNNKILEKKLNTAKAKSVNKLQSEKNYIKFKFKKISELEKVESKLNEKTEAIKEKQRKKHDYKSNKIADTMGGNVLGRIGRAVPQWRRGLNN